MTTKQCTDCNKTYWDAFDTCPHCLNVIDVNHTTSNRCDGCPARTAVNHVPRCIKAEYKSLEPYEEYYPGEEGNHDAITIRKPEWCPKDDVNSNHFVSVGRDKL